MTAVAPLPGLPTWSVDTLTVAAYRTTDELGREWGASGGDDKGWVDPPATRTKRSDRPFSHGSFRSTAYRDSRQFTIGGYVACPTAAIREQTELELSALCSDPGRLYEFRRRTDNYDMVAMVELDDAPKIEMVTFYRLDWLFTFAAPDPRKHDYAWQTPASGVASPGAYGLDFTGGLDFTNAGMDFGTPPTMSIAKVANYGTAPAFPVFELTGQLPTADIVHLETGVTLTYSDVVAAGETVTINCDDFPQRNQPGKTCLSSTRGNVRSLLTIGTRWPQVDPGEVATFQLRAAPSINGQMRTLLRSAWY